MIVEILADEEFWDFDLEEVSSYEFNDYANTIDAARKKWNSLDKETRARVERELGDDAVSYAHESPRKWMPAVASRWSEVMEVVTNVQRAYAVI